VTLQGAIRKLAVDKGYGFITGDDGEDYFFHRSAVDQTRPFDELAEGMQVEFRPSESAKGLRADAVRVR
jgi:cold shock protein